MTADILTIGGRKFRGVGQELTAAQDDFLIGHLRAAGAIDTLLKGYKDPDDDEHAERLLTQILISGRTPQILAGCLTEEGTKWSYEEATRNAAAFATVTDPQDKMAMRSAIVGFVVGFFLCARQSAKNSPKSSNRTSRADVTSNAGPGTSANGLSLSEPFRSGIPTESTTSGPGRSAISS